LIALITRRSEVRILPPLLKPSIPSRNRGFFFAYSGITGLNPYEFASAPAGIAASAQGFDW
jgi:hypothetical protein